LLSLENLVEEPTAREESLGSWMPLENRGHSFLLSPEGGVGGRGGSEKEEWNIEGGKGGLCRSREAGTR
jgi:hypothetical protein